MYQRFFSVPWQIKQIFVNPRKRNDPRKFDHIVHAMKQRASIKDFSDVLWEVSWMQKEALNMQNLGYITIMSQPNLIGYHDDRDWGLR